MIQIIRLRTGNNSTLSHLYIDSLFVCSLLEDKIRPEKLKSKTCIPDGVYTLGLNKDAGMNVKYQKNNAKNHKGMIEIQGIPTFSLVFFHIGNTHLDTQGCPLVGHYYREIDGEFEVLQSAQAYRSVYPILYRKIQSGATAIEVINQINQGNLLWG